MSLPLSFAGCMARNTVFILSLAMLGLSACSMRDVPADWKTDCVGRMQISLPEQADVAGVTPKGLDELHSGSGRFGFYFPDGQRAGYSQVSFFGRVAVTRPLTSEEMRAMHAGVEDEQKFIKQNMGPQAKKKANRNLLKELSVSPQTGFGWHVRVPTGSGWDIRDEMGMRLFLGSQYFSWDVSVTPERLSVMEKAFKVTVSGLTLRENFTLPTDAGVCLPYTFIRDDGTSSHSIGTTYRLQSHPDVTILLEAGGAAGSKTTQKAEAIYKSNDFWTQLYRPSKSMESLLHGSHNSIKFAGQKGIETMVKIIRDDDTEDYGYLVVMHGGDPDIKEDTSELMMYVIRDAKNAKAKGIEPISKEAFFTMAQTIAASVKRRPVNQPDKMR